jgi:hypothetical protein
MRVRREVAVDRNCLLLIGNAIVLGLGVAA